MIYLLNTKDNIALQAFTQHFKFSDFQTMKAIQREHGLLQEALSKKGIRYSDLKYALIPSIDRERHECVLVFDMNKDSSFYGLSIAFRLLKTVDDTTPHSILLGDYLNKFYPEIDSENILKNMLLSSLGIEGYPEYQYSEQFYLVYINNVTNQQLSVLNKFMAEEKSAVGIADITHACFFKDYLSYLLASCFIIFKGKAIAPSSDYASEAVWAGNDTFFSFEDAGYTSFSVADLYWHLFLSYKIETRITDPEDIRYSINSISDKIVNLDNLDLRMDESKLAYLLKEKLGSLKSIGLHSKDINEVRNSIRQKISESWLYNLCIDEEHNIMKFNVILDYDSKKILVALEYLPLEKQIRLITLY